MGIDNDQFNSLSRKLESTDVKVRYAAIETLEGHHDIKAVRLLLKALNDNSNQNRSKAGELLMRCTHPAAISGAVSLLDSEQFHVKASIQQLLEAQPSEKVFPAIQDLIQDPHLEDSLRIRLIPLFILHCDSSSQKKVGAFLTSTDQNVKKAVVSGLCKSDRDWVIPSLLEFLGSGNSNTSLEVIRSLSKRIGHQELISTLLGLVKDPGRKGDEAVSVLTHIADVTCFDKLTELFVHSRGSVRKRSIQIAGAVDPARAIEPALDMLSDKDSNTVHQAETFLESRNLHELQGPVFKKLEDESADSKKLKKVLLNSLDRMSLDQIIACLTDTEIDKRLTENLCNRIADDQIDPLVDYLKNQDTETVTDFLSVLVRYQKTDLVNALIGHLDLEIDEDTAISLQRELKFRGMLTQNAIRHHHLSIAEIESFSRDRGWSSTSPILNYLGSSSSASDIASKRSRLQETIRREEKTVLELESRLADVTEEIESASRKRSNRLLFVIMIILGSISAMICLYMNWKPTSGNYWYPGLVMSTLIAATGIFSFRRTLKAKPGKRKKQDPVEVQASTARKLEKVSESLARNQAELDTLEQEVISGEGTQTQDDLNELFRILKSADV